MLALERGGAQKGSGDFSLSQLESLGLRAMRRQAPQTPRKPGASTWRMMIYKAKLHPTEIFGIQFRNTALRISEARALR